MHVSNDDHEDVVVASDLTKAKNKRNVLRRERSAQVQRDLSSREVKRANGNVISKLTVAGVTTTDRSEWEQALVVHATSKYTDPG